VYTALHPLTRKIFVKRKKKININLLGDFKMYLSKSNFLNILFMLIVSFSNAFADDKYLKINSDFLKATNFSTDHYPQAKKTLGEFYQTSIEVEKCKFKTFMSLDAVADGTNEPVIWTQTMIFSLKDLDLLSLKIYKDSGSLWIDTTKKKKTILSILTEPGHPGWNEKVDFTSFLKN